MKSYLVRFQYKINDTIVNYPIFFHAKSNRRAVAMVGDGLLKWSSYSRAEIYRLGKVDKLIWSWER